VITESYPCPKCGKHRLIYDGMLVWRSGPRPPRKESFSSRADYERERLYHCDQCGAEFFQDVEQRSIHLYEENVAGQYLYNGAWRAWEWRRFDPIKREWTTLRLEPQWDASGNRDGSES
jgi:DNA-directed RNA polymerase subunit RPC12/RpoP